MGIACSTERPGDACGGTATTRSPLVGGTQVSTDAGVSAEDDDGVGYLEVEDMSSGRPLWNLCAVSRIGRGAAISAAHCFEGATQWHAWVGFSEHAVDWSRECAPADGRYPVLSHRVHPTLDLDLLTFDDPGGPVLPVAEALPPIGEGVVMVGYGLTEDNVIGEKRYARSKIVAERDDTVTVSSDGNTGACSGDSGGPLLHGDPAARLELIGILTAGSLSCRGQDVYVSSSAFSDWLITIEGEGRE